MPQDQRGEALLGLSAGDQGDHRVCPCGARADREIRSTRACGKPGPCRACSSEVADRDGSGSSTRAYTRACGKPGACRACSSDVVDRDGSGRSIAKRAAEEGGRRAAPAARRAAPAAGRRGSAAASDRGRAAPDLRPGAHGLPGRLSGSLLRRRYRRRQGDCLFAANAASLSPECRSGLAALAR
jgi:hypothetical protein